ncbi:uncharacterized protein LOC114940560 [Nylanderia fulva]|uniref:uncharacterized protein LOC114940560 n=1 Tax=Nylanderia fulva TaxID=613905 RepID=UPI0010FB55E0|nr:uncharacterized protein LOC114940560 [Nylanderia fulva]
MDMDQMIDAQHELYLRILRSVENLKKIGASKLNAHTVQAAIRVLDDKWAKFTEQHEELRAHFWKEIKREKYTTEDLLSKVETAYYGQRSELAGLEEQFVEPVGPALGERVRETAPSRRTLPRINLPQFSGKFKDWPAYRDLFSSMVLGDASLTKIEQLHYLKISVKGDAEQLIRNLPSTEENLEDAWELLTTYFENKRLLVRSYLTAFTSLPRLKAPSADGLRRLFHGVLTTVGALKGIGRPISDCTDLFVHLVVELLDAETRREWESSLRRSSEPPSYDKLREFLQEQLMTWEVLQSVKTVAPAKPTEKSSRSSRSSHVGTRGSDPNRSCPLCKRDHFIAYCEQYKKKTVSEKREAINTHQRCWNCLGRHLLADCKSHKACATCSGRHHTTLHDAFAAVALPATASSSSTTTVHVARRPPRECGPALLATARVFVADRVGTRHAVRALIDPGSETSLIAESLAQRLRLPRTPSSVAIFGVGGIQTGVTHGRITATVSSRDGHFALAVLPLVFPRLTVYGGTSEGEARSWPHLDGLELADPEFHRRDAVELLLGADVYLDLALPEGFRRGGPREPGALLTRFGWVLLGVVGAGHVAAPVSSLQCSTGDDLVALVRRFWETEEPPRAALPLTADEQECKDHFVRTHVRLEDGRYQVRLPFRPGLPDLSSTRRTASRLLDVMRRRFIHDREFGLLYRDFMNEYLTLGHMSPVSAASLSPGSRICFLPHHGVLRSSSTTSKIRVVFNGSARTGGGSSLNNWLLTGRNLLPSLADTLTRWRRHRYVFVADIKMMYRQIQLHRNDRDLQRILWTEGDEVKEFQLNTVTYGLASAPYLAIRVLHQLAIDEVGRFPLGADVLRQDVYMDDVLTGAATLDAADDLLNQVAALCTAGGFPLRKWAANDDRLLVKIPLAHRLDVMTGARLPSESHSVLGLRWNPREDVLSLSVRPTSTALPTKRSVLSQTARLFDPLGWLAPIIVRAKLLVQSAWIQQLDWDAPLTRDDAAEWTRLEVELPLLEEIRVPRWFQSDAANNSQQLHGFCDASERAYAAVIYLRGVINGQPDMTLVVAKTKVAPVKRVSLPRLELCGATFLAKLAEHVRSSLGLEGSAVHLWTDSTVTLGWIRGHPARWTTFVANRVAEIHRENQDAKWRHVPGRDNPADCASRGVSPRELLRHPL